jgi:prolyl oligopeptidase
LKFTGATPGVGKIRNEKTLPVNRWCLLFGRMCFSSRIRAVFPAILGLGLAAASAGFAPLAAIPTAREPVTNIYQRGAVVDDYQWLEDAASPAVRDWTRQQNERTRAWFDRLEFHDGLEQELSELIADESASYGLDDCRGGIIFATRFKPPAQQPVLVRLKSVYPPALRKVVFDPNVWNTNGTTAMDWSAPSTDGRFVAICLSENGSENGVLHFFETDTGRALPDIIPGVQYPTGGGSAAWNADGTGIFYTRYPQPGERPEGDLHFYQQIWFHKLGTPVSADTYELGRDFPRIAEIELAASEDGRWLLATVANGDGGDFAHYLRDASGSWHQLTRFEDGIKVIKFGKDAALYLLSKKNAPRGKILRLPLADPDLAKATVVVPEGRGVVDTYEPSASGLYVAVMEGGPSRLWFYSHGSRVEVPILPVSSVSGLHCWHGDELLFSNTSFLVPPGWYEWEPGLARPRPTALRMTSPADFDDIEVVREFATSKDGTKIPISILRKKGIHLDGRNPTLLTGYGGYGISLTPAFSSTRRIWFDAGGVYAVANLRGGGEFGEEWHLAGNLTHKQHVFDDLVACAEHLIQRKYTSPDKLAVMGSSNGGLLMGAFLTQRPDLARAVVSRVGIYDMLRVELDPNGAFNTTEFGSVKDADQFQALHAYSPYHHVKDGAAYPAVLFPCGENDGRVNPAHSRKMTARLQAATGSGRPILLRTTATAGHGMGSSLKDRVAEQADIYAFLLQELGVDTSPWTFK